MQRLHQKEIRIRSDLRTQLSRSRYVAIQSGHKGGSLVTYAQRAQAHDAKVLSDPISEREMMLYSKEMMLYSKETVVCSVLRTPN